MTDLPLKVPTFVTAMAEAQEISLACDYHIYLFRVNSGGYVIDCQAGAYSDEVLIWKLIKGEKQ